MSRNILQEIGTFEEQCQARRVQQQKQYEYQQYHKASWPGDSYTAAFWGRDLKGGQDIVEELRALKFPGAYETWQNEMKNKAGGTNVQQEYFAFADTLRWVKKQAKHVAYARVGNCQVGNEFNIHKHQRYMTYTDAFEALVLTEMPAALAAKEVADAAAAVVAAKLTDEAAKRKEKTARLAEAKITAEALRRIKVSAETDAFESAVQRRMAQILSSDETVNTHTQ